MKDHTFYFPLNREQNSTFILHLIHESGLKAKHVENYVDGKRGENHCRAAQDQVSEILVFGVRRVATRIFSLLLDYAWPLDGHAMPSRCDVSNATVYDGLLRYL